MTKEFIFNGTVNRVAEESDVLFSNYKGKRAWILKQIFSSKQECIEYVYRVFGIDAYKSPMKFQCKLDVIIKEVMAA